VTNRQVGPGPGTVRVASFVGKLGVVSLPSVEAGLDLDQRVVRRHVARLEAAGWMVRSPWIWGEGSVVWLTGAGLEAAGLGGLRAFKSPPAPTTIAHGVLVGWSAARAERRHRVWRSSRELAVDPERWAVQTRCERGYTHQLPDLAVWLKRSGPPMALIAESGGRREDRQTMLLQGWRDALWSGHYAAVQYDCASPSVARRMARLARKIGLEGSAFKAVVQMTPEQVATVSPAAETDEPEADELNPAADQMRANPEPDRVTTIRPPPPPDPIRQSEPAPTAPPQAETAEAAAERERSYREIFGIEDGKPRRRWRR